MIYINKDKRLNKIVNYKQAMGYTPGIGYGVFQIAKTIVENPFLYKIPFIGKRLKFGSLIIVILSYIFMF
jgi:hypothetical protein